MASPKTTGDGPRATLEPDKTDTPDSSQEPTKRSTSRPSSARRTRRPSSLEWNHTNGTNGSGLDKKVPSGALPTSPSLPAASAAARKKLTSSPAKHRHGSWSISKIAFLAATIGLVLLAGIVKSLVSRQLEPKGCRMSYMRPSYIHYREFDTEHTRFATKYSLYLYREQGLDDEHRLRGIPVLFIPGNAGSYKQVRPIAAEASTYYHEQLQQDSSLLDDGVRSLDFFTVDFNEDITAFHGQTLLDQAEYLNEAVRYILSLYSDPNRTLRDDNLPDPTSVIIVGHSMGGVVARAMLVQPNYQLNSINTIITMSAPHARPPVTFDGQIVQIYDDINAYWREAYSQKWASNNPLWHVTLISIAGGSLDTVVPSDYASLDSLVPETHGFTVYTTGIPTVWTSADHQAILWCDQFRQVVSKALFEIVDVHRASQTRPRAERIRTLRRHFLTGMEAGEEKAALRSAPSTLLNLDDAATRVRPAGERLVLRQLGTTANIQAHLLPVPQPDSSSEKHFTFISESPLDNSGGHGHLEVLLCSAHPSQASEPVAPPATTLHLAESDQVTTQLLCKNAAVDTVLLPTSNSFTTRPFYLEGEPETRPYSYLQYEMEHLSDIQFVAVIDKAASPLRSFVVAEFSDLSHSKKKINASLGELLLNGVDFELPANHPLSVDVSIPAMQSSLLAYKMQIQRGSCKEPAMFEPLIRQHLEQPHESKFFVNAYSADISLHGVAPYMPPSLQQLSSEGASLQFWTDPTCEAPLRVSIRFDVFGSLGKLYMRYRTVFAAFPLLIVTLVLRRQFRAYDETGSFIPFSESLDLSLRRSIPLLLLSMTLLAASIGGAPYVRNGRIWNRTRAAPFTDVDFHKNDLLIGTDDAFFTVLVPIIGFVCIGVCTSLHYLILTITKLFSVLYGASRKVMSSASEGDTTSSAPVIVASTPRRRMISTAILLFLVATFIPYQFAFLVACLVQLFTTVRALRILTVSPSVSNANYYHYCHSILLLMMWVLPINLPILAVWIRNLAVHWLTPFSSHHNVLSIMPFILLVENLTTGRMVPRISSGLRHVTSVLLFSTALCAALYGVSHAYMLHYLVNIIAAWLVVLHSTSTSWSITGIFEGNANETRKPNTKS